MKTLKFTQKLSELILKGEKTTTWRLFDDKDLRVGDELNFIVKETGKHFADAVITEVKETEFGGLKSEHFEGHEKFSSGEEMYKTYSKYYKRTVDKNTPLKIIKFEVTRKSSDNS